jgi:Leucine-rich repeat (LRR) protein
MTNLHHMDLSGCGKLKGLPDSFGSLTNLHHMDLSRCGKLERLPDSFGSLMNLHHMNLACCRKLKRLPDSLGSLTNLHHINLTLCRKLERLPDSFGSLMNLHHLDLSLCKKLERLPNSFGSCNRIKYLNSSCCSNLTISSDTLGNIRTLEHIDFSGCGKIEVWPLQLAHQRSLKIMKLTGTNIKELPSAIEVPTDLEVLWAESPLLDTLHPLLGDLRNLKELRLKDCRELKCLPASVGRLSQLTQLEVAGCPAIELPFKKVREQRETVRTLKSNSSIHKYMPCLQELTLQDTEISEVSFDEGVCPNLRKFILRECINLVEVGTLPNTLTYVKLQGVPNRLRES